MGGKNFRLNQTELCGRLDATDCALGLGYFEAMVSYLYFLQRQTSMKLRPYQQQQDFELRKGISLGAIIQMLMSPTGSGKTEVDDRRKVLGPTSKLHTFCELLGYARETGKKDGWAHYAYQAYMKELPDRSWIGTVEPKAPSDDMKSWVKGYNVRRAKSKRRFA